MCILGAAMNARYHMTVVTEEIQTLMWIQQELEAIVALQKNKNKKTNVLKFILYLSTKINVIKKKYQIQKNPLYESKCL